MRIALPDRRYLAVRGRDAEKWLQNLCTQDVRKPGDLWAAFCDRTGRMQGVARIWRAEGGFTLATDAAALAAHLRKFIIMERVEIEELPLRGYATSEPGDHALEWTAEPMFEIAAESLDADPLETLERTRIAYGAPRWGADMGPDDLPMEAGLTARAISYEKGCYLGQEVILRLRNFGELPKMLRLLDVEAPPGTPVDEGGVVTGSAGGLSLAYVRKPHYAEGSPVTVAGRTATVRVPAFQR